MNYSRQREAIISFLKTRKDHPTAEVIYQNVRQNHPRISLATVYRNLSMLSERGDILRIQVGDGTDHFDYDTSPHNHFVCRECGCVLDLEMRPFDEINEAASTYFDGVIEGHVTYFYGLCPTCAQ
jgi:Fur family peroxide stress response transcriptional regulator